jgi:glucosyl-3-phosphoglycerate phosphatase
MTTYLYLRHAETAVSSSERWHGKEDPPLSPVGRKHATIAAQSLLRLPESATILASKACRTRETAKIFSEILERPVVPILDLRERDLGDWTGLSIAEINDAWPGAIAAWREGRICGPPGGETDDQVATRLARILFEYDTDANDGLHLIIAHAGLLRGLMASQGTYDEEVPPLGGRWLRLLPATRSIAIGDPVLL